MKTFFLTLFSVLILASGIRAQRIEPGAEQFDEYLPQLKGKRVGIFANHTTVVANNQHLVDALQKKDVKITRIFAPEHGFRGTADAGEKVASSIDPATGIPVISLYGKNRIPSKADLDAVDVLIFDVQDVGVRFYTYISSLEEFMESAIRAKKPLVLLDRPNPNGFYIDGPILEKPYRSFVGMQPVPVVYGMTIGEYAKMLVGEKWLDSTLSLKGFQLTVIPCKNYTHQSRYSLPVKPSPNLPDMSAIYWYPSTCFFEGTVLSEGRGTDHPFQVFGHPDLPKTGYNFTPRSMEGAKNPKLKDKLCNGWNLAGEPDVVFNKVNGQLQLDYLLEAYRLFPNKEKFFLGGAASKSTEFFFNKLAGNSELMNQIKTGKTMEEIRASWKDGLEKFKKIRAKYLIYQ